VILWINGAFGSGKTQAAFELKRRLENSFVFDPENTGYFLRQRLPREIMPADFQDLAAWRSINAEILAAISARQGTVVIVPMTVYRKQYFDEITVPLRAAGIRIDHWTCLITRLVRQLRWR
jgi:adenylylsulfate kinase-like enzyme